MPEIILDGKGSGNVWQIDSNNAGLITGSIAITNAHIDVDVTVADYVSVTQSGAYIVNLGSVAITNIVPVSNANAGSLNVAMKWIDDTGSVNTFKSTTDGKIRVTSNRYTYDISEGNIPGHKPFSKQGLNFGVGTTEADIWSVGGTYVYPVSGIPMEVVSTSAADTSNGVGVRSVYIQYLDNNFVEKRETIILSGTTVIPTVAQDIYRINAFRALTCGASGISIGSIALRNIADTPIYSQIGVGRTRARNICYTVPSGHTLYINQITFSAGDSTQGKSVRFTTKAKYDNITGSILDFFIPYTESIIQDQSFTQDLNQPTKFPSNVDIKVSAVSDSAGANCTCSIHGWLEF